ncbi:cysteine desulfurase family protein [Scatolibacter rhodanostii]|uniref:cysteine desulfurase family protein n=1 Tax=Scatolibacter rhodanostii TaxID=2014781 RepID=UPI000C074C26|nr:cysteine desulfurase family protein [Scatolibacter rhodanostii]
MSHNDFIYADNAATTAVLPAVADAMLPFFTEIYGNASSPYEIGRRAKSALENARAEIAHCFGCDAAEIFFTSGGTESNNWAIQSIMKQKSKESKTHIITSQIEHHSILRVCQEWEKEGGTVTYLPVDKNGLVNPADVEKSIRGNTALVSIMAANNEIGTLQPLQEIGGICRSHNVLFHTDAVQAVGHLPINPHDIPVDLFSFSAHKFHGPKGIGGLYVNRSVNLPPLLFGGEQERAKRPGTQNVAAAVGLSTALSLACQEMTERNEKIRKLRDLLIENVLKIPGSSLNGDPNQRLPGNANFCFEGIEGESLLLMMDMHNIYCSSGSACTSGATDPSHVILALGVPKDLARSSVRISLSHLNTEEDVRQIISVLEEAISRLRRLRP